MRLSIDFSMKNSRRGFVNLYLRTSKDSTVEFFDENIDNNSESASDSDISMLFKDEKRRYYGFPDY